MSPQLRDLWSAYAWKVFGYDVSRVSAMTVKKVSGLRFTAKGVREQALIVFFWSRSHSPHQSPACQQGGTNEGSVRDLWLVWTNLYSPSLFIPRYPPWVSCRESRKMAK